MMYYVYVGLLAATLILWGVIALREDPPGPRDEE